jgi:succinyl-diaminopimelate desuccinylase
MSPSRTVGRPRHRTIAVPGKRSLLSTEMYGFTGTTDIRNLVNGANMEAVTWGPAPMDQAHTIDEYFELDPVYKSVEILNASTIDLLDA